MTNLVLLIMPLVGGYYFLSRCNLTRFEAYKDTGYRLFLGSALVGIVLLLIAKITVSLFNLDYFASEFFIPTGFNLESLLAMTFGIVLPFFVNSILLVLAPFFDTGPRELTRRVAKNRGDFLYIRINDAIDMRQLIELTMQNGKVYIGYITKFGGLDSECVDLVTYASGYRDQKTRDLVITCDYSIFVVKMGKEFFSEIGITPFDLNITLKMSDVATARVFYPDVYTEFERQRSWLNAQV